MQGKFQAAGIFVSLAMALVGGIIVGEWECLGQRRWGRCGWGYQRSARSAQKSCALVAVGLGWVGGWG